MPIRFYSLTVDEIRDETPDAYSIFLQPPSDAPAAFAYRAGQYLTVRRDIAGEDVRRALSLASSPGLDARLRLTIKRVPGGQLSNHLRDTLQVGDALEVMPPMGQFVLYPQPEAHHHYLLIGAGSGITPLYSLLRTALAEEPRSQVSLWYGNRNQASIIFGEELHALGAQYPDRLEVVHVLSQPEAGWAGYTGRLDQARIYDLVSEVFMTSEGHKQYYLCGPTGLMEAAEAALEVHAVNFANVHREHYHAPLPSDEDLAAQEVADQEAGLEADTLGEVRVAANGQSQAPIGRYEAVPREVTVHLDGQAHAVSVSPDQPILQAAINAELSPPYSCLSGVCTSCRARLQHGAVTMKVALGLSDEDLQAQYILTCQALPLTDGVVVSYDE
jgi:ring-1,2-phenylacetyl-CoA epoxidase subunit PaaE